MIDIVDIKRLCKEEKFKVYTKVHWTPLGNMRCVYLQDISNGETVCLGKEKTEESFVFIGAEE